jgi:hypothetical protein
MIVKLSYYHYLSMGALDAKDLSNFLDTASLPEL